MDWDSVEDVIDIIATVLAHAVSIAAVAYVFQYSLSNWRAYQAGRVMMRQALAVIALMVLALSTIYFGTDFTGHSALRLMAYGFLLWALVSGIRALRGYQRATLGMGHDPDKGRHSKVDDEDLGEDNPVQGQ